MARQRVLVCGHGEETFMHDLLVALDTELPRGSVVRSDAPIRCPSCFWSCARDSAGQSCPRTPGLACAYAGSFAGLVIWHRTALQVLMKSWESRRQSV